MIVTTIVAVGLCAANYELKPGIMSGGSWRMTTGYSQGWPAIFRYLLVDEIGPFDRAGKASTTTTEIQWNTTALWFDAIAVTLLVAATAVVCEGRCRDILPWRQLRLQSMLILVTVVSCLLVIYQNDIGLVGLSPNGFGMRTGWLSATPWYQRLPILFGLGCLIYLVGRLAVLGVVSCGRWLRRAVLRT
jgi:hypothetical protein